MIRHERALVGRAFAGWLHVVTTAARARAAAQAADAFARSSRLRTALGTWRAWAVRSLRNRRLVAFARAARERAIRADTLAAWRAWVSRRSRARELLARADAGRRRRLLRTAFDALARAPRFAALEQRVQTRSLATVLAAWRTVLGRAAERARVWARAQAHAQAASAARLLPRAMRAWQSVVARRRAARRKLAAKRQKADAHFARRSLVAWRRVARQIGLERRQTAAASALAVRAVARRVLGRWHRWTCLSRELGKFVARRKARQVRQVLLAWAKVTSAASVARARKQALIVARRAREVRAMATAWRAWRDDVDARTNARLELAGVYRVRTLLRLAMRGFASHAAQSRELMSRAEVLEQARMESLARRALFKWQEATAAAAAAADVAHWTAVAAAHRDDALMRRALRGWAAHVEARALAEAQVAEAVAFARYHRLTRAMTTWRGAAVLVRERRLLRYAFEYWFEVTQATCEFETRIDALLQLVDLNTKSRMFFRWKQMYTGLQLSEATRRDLQDKLA